MPTERRGDVALSFALRIGERDPICCLPHPKFYMRTTIILLYYAPYIAGSAMGSSRCFFKGMVFETGFCVIWGDYRIGVFYLGFGTPGMSQQRSIG